MIRENNGLEDDDSSRTATDIERQILKEVLVFCLSSHLLWTLWSLKQAQNSNIPFAYYSFAKDRMEDYREKKLEVLAMINTNDAFK